MRKLLFSLMAVTLFAGSFAWAGADDDKAARSGEKTSSPSPGAKPSESAKPGTPAAESSAVESELQQLRELIQEQTERLRGLQERLADVEGKVTASKSVSNRAASSATAAVQPATPADSVAASAQPPAARQEDNKDQEKKPSPLYFEIGRAKFTPGGFVDFTSLTRSTNVGGGLSTSFGTIPFSNTPAGRLSENRLSAQYSRLSLKVDAPVTNATSVTAYVETDFFGFQPPNANITSNSYGLRLREFWADVKHGKWEVLGGQDWTLLQANRRGDSPYTPDVFYTYNEDQNFQVGLVWARQAQFRVTYHPTQNLAVAVSAENPQQFAPASVVFPSTTYLTQFDNGSSFTNTPSASTNLAVPNLHPDFIVKVAYDTELAHRPFHIEVAGLIRSFRVLNTLVTPNRTSTITGGGGSINFNLQLVKNLTLIANSFYSDGGGRYLGGLGPDAIVKPNGNLSAVHASGGLGGLEWQASRRYLFATYYGIAYFNRNFGFLPTPGSTCNGRTGFSCVGFGFPGSANITNRDVQEATFDAIPTLWSSENYGKLQVITQYSYLVRSPWSTLTTPPTPKNAHLSMVYAGIRYILP